MKLIFQNSSPWSVVLRSILFWIAFLISLVACGFLTTSFFPHSLSRFGYGILGSFAALIVTWLFLKTEKQTFRAIGLIWENKSSLRFFGGLGIGSLIFGLIAMMLITLSDITFQLNPETFKASMLIGYLVFIPLALMEEIGFRAYTFVKLTKATGLFWTQLIVALAFALYHIANGWSIEAAFLGTFVWAWVFGLGAAWSGGIAFPTGLHVAVNVLQGLTGMKHGNSIWIVVMKTPEAVGGTLAESQVGLIIHGFILLTAIVLTNVYSRRVNYRLK